MATRGASRVPKNLQRRPQFVPRTRPRSRTLLRQRQLPRLTRVITAVHTLVYAHDADAARAFFRDVLRWPHVDAHDGWLVFRTGPSELGVHPTSDAPQHQISLMCDDLEQTMADLRAKGAEFAGEVSEVVSGGR